MAMLAFEAKPGGRMATPKKKSPTKATVKTATLLDLIQYSAKLIAEKKALRAVLERKGAKGWRDDYSHEFQQKWQNQGHEADVLHALLREKRVSELLDTLATELSRHVDLDE
jgi:uncharacterized membrane-anchored protein YjiN (DUF445 family)